MRSSYGDCEKKLLVCLQVYNYFCFCVQCESHGIPLPTLDEVDSKANQFNEARYYMYNEDDVDKVCEQSSKVWFNK